MYSIYKNGLNLIHLNNKMVFTIEKYDDKLQVIMASDNAQEGLTNFIKTSSKNFPLKFTTYVPRMTTLRKYLREKYNFEYIIDNQILNEYKNMMNKRFEGKDQLTIDISKVYDFMEKAESEIDNKITEDDIKEYLHTSRNKVYKNNLVSRRIIYLLLTSGRRITELYERIIGYNEETDNINYKPLKKKQSKVEEFTPFIDSKIWIKLYDSISPVLEKEYNFQYFTTRINRYVKELDMKWTTHTLRKVYAEICSKNNKKRIVKTLKIKNCLNHDNVNSSVRYDIKTVDNVTCNTCNKTVLKKNFKRHLRSYSHMKLEYKEKGM